VLLSLALESLAIVSTGAATFESLLAVESPGAVSVPLEQAAKANKATAANAKEI
jgi:hypothetical protein